MTDGNLDPFAHDFSFPFLHKHPLRIGRTLIHGYPIGAVSVLTSGMYHLALRSLQLPEDAKPVFYISQAT